MILVDECEDSMEVNGTYDLEGMLWDFLDMECNGFW